MEPIIKWVLGNAGNNTVLAVQHKDDGSLELVMPITQNTPQNALQILQAPNSGILLNQLPSNNVPKGDTQQYNISAEVIDLKTQYCTLLGSGKTVLDEVVNQHSSIITQQESYNHESIHKIYEKSLQELSELQTPLISQETLPLRTTEKKLKSSSGKRKSKPKKKSKLIDYFKCSICQQEFKQEYLFQKHMREYHQEKPHQCPKCSASFNVPTNFTLHLATHKIGEPKCPLCDRKFARMVSLKSHMQQHEKDENLYCTECESVFEFQAQLETHLRLHDEQWSAEGNRKCKLCHRQFSQSILYRQHLRDHYRMQTKYERKTKKGWVKYSTRYTCKICLKFFSKPSQLSRHLRVHTGEKPYKCNLCNRSFTQKGSLRIHMCQHKGIKPYSCSFCHAKFSQKGNLNAHIIRVHETNIKEGSTIYRCTQCPCIFKTLGSLNGHIRRTHSGKSGDSNVPDKEPEEDAEPTEEEIRATVDTVMHQLADLESCVQRTNFARKPGQDDEVVTVMDISVDKDDEDEGNKENQQNEVMDETVKEGFVASEDNETAVVTVLDKTSENSKGRYIKIKQRFVNNFRCYECSYCDKKFKKPSDLLRHLRIHTKEKPFKCKKCGRSFTLKSTLMSHERTHQDEPHKCSICSAIFNFERQYKDHMKFHESGYKCSFCNDHFMTFDELKKHADVHVTEMSKKQKKAEKKYSPEVQKLAPTVVLKEPLVITEASNGQLEARPNDRKELSHDKGRPHKCPICPAAFMKISHLKQHTKKHTGERPHACNLCERRFATTSSLNAHLRTHDLSKPFKCSTCDMTFSTSSSMKRHYSTHTSKRPFMCPYCNKTFKTNVSCRKHMQVHKAEIALQQLELKKNGEENPISILNPIDNRKEMNVITFVDDNPISNSVSLNLNQPSSLQIVTQPDIVYSLEQQLQTLTNEKSDIILSSTTSQNIPVVATPNIGTTTQTLHADETGTVTLPNYTSDHTLTPENMKEIEDTLNQQLLSIGMNLSLTANNKSIEETQNQPVLNIIYDTGKNFEAHVNTNVFNSQFETFDINQITFQGDQDIGLEITQANSANMASILPKSIQENHGYNFTTNNVIQQDEINNDNQVASISSTISSENCNTNDSEQYLAKENSLQCHMCKKQPFTSDDLKEHLKTHKSDKEYECSQCQSKFCTSSGLSRHMKVHADPSEKHKCYECQEEFNTARQLIQHIKEHVKHELSLKNIPVSEDMFERKKNNVCSFCDKTFRKPSDLTRHLRTHTGERPYKCPHCEKSFAVKCTLDSHLKVHAGENPVYCHVCNSKFATKGSLKVHMRLHTGFKPFSCSTCGMFFRTSGQRKVHMAFHIKEPNLLSRKIKQPTPAIAALAAEVEKLEQSKEEQNHIVQIVHSTPVPQQISTDQQIHDQNLATITLNSINDQVTLSTDGTILNDASGLLSLNESNQLVANLQYLLANGLVTIHTDDSSMSTQSPMSTVDLVHNDFVQNNISQRIEEHSDLEPQVVFTTETPVSMQTVANTNDFQLDNCMVLQLENVDSTTPGHDDEIMKQSRILHSTTRRECDICGKAFAKPCLVERHKRTHTGERPYTCETCGKSFAQKSTLHLHERNHTGDRPYSCPLCNRTFTQSGNLQTHFKRIHKLEAEEIRKIIKQQQFVSYVTEEDGKMIGFDDFSIADLLKEA